MKDRIAKLQVEKSLSMQPAVILLGPHRVGKTTLSQEIAVPVDSVYLNMERYQDRQTLLEPDLCLREQAARLVVIDQVQLMPELFTVLREQIDRRRCEGHQTGQFLLLGSASNALLHQSGESLAGQAVLHKLSGLNLVEVGQGALNKLWLRGGFPESFLAPDEEASTNWREDFIRTYLERHIPMLGPRIPATTLLRFWSMLAHRQGRALNAAQMATGLGISGQSVVRYLDLMVDLMLVRKLKPWRFSMSKRLVKSPKIYVRDSGLTHALLNIQTYEALLGHPVVVGSWKGVVIENLLTIAPRGTDACFYRTGAGAEIDLVLTLPNGEIWAIAIMHGTTPKVMRGFHTAAADIGARHRFLVYAGDQEVPMKGDIRALPVAAMMGYLAR